MTTQDFTEKVDQWRDKSRSGVIRWISASGVKWVDLAAAAGVPAARLRTLSVDAVELAAIARCIEAARPLSFEYGLYDEAERRYYTEAAIKTHGVLISVAPNEELRAQLEAKQREMKDAVAAINEVKLPLDQQWADVDFVSAPDSRRHECQRCRYQWNGRSPVPPTSCPRCRSPKWDDRTSPEAQIAECRHCGKQWRTKVSRPLRCPRCQRPDWEAADGDN